MNSVFFFIKKLLIKRILFFFLLHKYIIHYIIVYIIMYFCHEEGALYPSIIYDLRVFKVVRFQSIDLFFQSFVLWALFFQISELS